MGGTRFRRAVPPDVAEHHLRIERSERRAAAHRPPHLVRPRQAGIPLLAARSRRRLSRADGAALSDDGGGPSQRSRRAGSAPGDRSDGGDSVKVAVIGGGPGGLYFALLAKKAWPRWDITVYERNRPDDTFGFGVVFSDQTLDTFKAYDAITYERIRRRFAYWGDVDVVYKGQALRSGGNGFCGCSRVALLNILQDRGRELGVQMRFQRDVDDVSEFADSDLIVVADGINSKIREKHKQHFQPAVDLRPNKFTWLGSTKPLDAFKYFFRETQQGLMVAHCYQYEPDRSTWVIETDEQTWKNFGFDTLSETEMLPVIENVFAEELDGHRLINNRSLWRNFPTITNKTWVMGNAVLVGDAKATAHFSIGSGTKLAMEDAIALYEAFRRNTDVSKALHLYDTARREEVEKTQHAANVSLAWFEHLRRYWGMDPEQFAFG